MNVSFAGPYKNLHAVKMLQPNKPPGNLINFTANESKEDTNDTKENNAPKKKPSKWGLNRLTALLFLLSGLTFVTSGLQKNKDKKVTENVDPKSKVEEVIKDEQKPPVVNLKNDTVNLKKLEEITAPKNQNELEKVFIENGFEKIDLNSLAKKLLGAATLINGLGLASLGIKKKQPSIVLSGALTLAASPFVVFTEPIRAMGAFYAAIGLLFGGSANIVENEFTNKSGNGKPREFDLSRISSAKGFNNMKAEIAEMMKFIKDDQVQVFESTKDATKQIYEWATCQRKEKPEVFTLQPSGMQRRVPGALLMVGGTLILLSVGPLSAIGNAAIALGGLADNVSVFALGNKQKGMARPAIMATVVTKQLAELLCIKFPGSALANGLKFIGIYGPNELSQQLESNKAEA